MSGEGWPACATYPGLDCVCRGGLQANKATCTRKRTGDLTPVPMSGEETTAGDPGMDCADGCTVCDTPAPPAASTGASEDVDRAAVDEILALFPMDEHGTGHIADCGYDANDERCDCYSLPERIATVLAAREAAARAAERERIAQAMSEEFADRVTWDDGTEYISVDAAARIAREQGR